MHPSIRSGSELKNRAASKIAAKDRRAIDVTGAVCLQIGVGIFTFILSKAKDDVRRCRRRRGHGQCDYKQKSCPFDLLLCIHRSSFLFPLSMISRVADPDETKNLAGIEVLRPGSDPL